MNPQPTLMYRMGFAKAKELMHTKMETEFEARVEKDSLKAAMDWMALRFSGNL